MFTMAQIDDLHVRLGRAESLGDYLRGLHEIGVVRFESFVTDGHTEFVAAEGQRLSSPAHHGVFTVAESSDSAALVAHLRRHAAGDTSYVEMSQALAGSGIERWVADTTALTMTYHDKAGTVLLIEDVE